MDTASLERLRAGIEEQASRHGAHVIELVVRGERGRRVIEVFVDSETGVSLDLCSSVSRSVVEAIEAGELLDGGYRLDVSSPGIDRPLKYSWQYKKHIGRQIRVRYRNGEEPAEVSGELLEVDDTGVTVRAGKGGEPRRVSFEHMTESTIKTPW